MFLELGLLLYGVYALISSRFVLAKNRALTGKKARILGVLCLSPIPISLMVVLFWILTSYSLGIHEETGKVVFISIFIETGVVLATLFYLIFLGYRFCSVPSKPNPRAIVIIALVVAVMTLIDIRSFGYKIFPEMLGEQLGAALGGMLMGAVGGVAFGLCAYSELRRQTKYPDD